MLPEHFKWTRVGASFDGPDRALECKGYEVARIAQKVTGEVSRSAALGVCEPGNCGYRA